MDVWQLVRMVLIATLTGVAAGLFVWVTGDMGTRLRLVREARREAQRRRDEEEAAKAAAEAEGEGDTQP